MATRIDRAGIEATCAVIELDTRVTPVVEASGADFGGRASATGRDSTVEWVEARR